MGRRAVIVTLLLGISTIGLLMCNFLLQSKDGILYILTTNQDIYSQRCANHIREPPPRYLENATRVLASRDPSRAAFFFVETSCGGQVNARQACAVESAAKLHPGADVYLLLLSPPSNLKVNDSQPLRTVQQHYDNVHVLYVHLEDYFRGSPLEAWYRSGALQTSNFHQWHTSDVFRFFTLWKYGGTYLDLDLFIIRTLRDLRNFAGAESENDIGSAILNFTPAHSEFALQCLLELRDNFQGTDWGSNGPGVITRVLQRVCREQRTSAMKTSNCRGFSVFPPATFYPVPWKHWRLYFDEEHSEATMLLLQNSMGVHVWNRFSTQLNVSVGSRQPYGLVAQRSCPRIYQASAPIF